MIGSGIANQFIMSLIPGACIHKTVNGDEPSGRWNKLPKRGKGKSRILDVSDFDF